MSYKIRYAREDDSAELARLRWELTADKNTPQTKDAFLDTCEQWILTALQSGRWFMAVASTRDQTLLGCMNLQLVDAVPSPNADSSGWGYITNAFVAAEHRNRQIGSELIQLLIKTARKEKLELLIVWPSEDSISFYNRAGFKQTDEIHTEDGDHPPLELQI